MTDIINPSPPQNALNPSAPEQNVSLDHHMFSADPVVPSDHATRVNMGLPNEAEPKRHSKDDTIALHHDLIRQLALEVRGASPSAAESISAKIIASLDAIRDPEAWQKRQDEARKVEDDREAERKAIREKLRPTAESKAVEKAT